MNPFFSSRCPPARRAAACGRGRDGRSSSWPSASRTAIAAEPTEPSDVVVALDFSSSILSDKPNRTKFANALDDIADRVEVTRDDLVNGNAVISLVPFASRAAGFPGCENLALHADPAAVQKLADCLRLAARQYRRGPDASIVSKVGSDTNYVKAMQQAATYLPADSTRPAVVFFTDGKHDVPGTPASAVLPEAQRLFGDRTPFAFLPVGMGLDPNAARRAAIRARGPVRADEQHVRVPGRPDLPLGQRGVRRTRPTRGTRWPTRSRR